MARIRTIKPEFPHSETVGKLSREARLLFILLWTIADDEGRARAASRMLASLLYPYDDDAPKLIGVWLDELDRTECIRRYTVNDSQYLEIVTWLIHQKIDKPSKSRLPPFGEASRIVAKPREASATDLGPRTGTSTKDHGDDDDGDAREPLVSDAAHSLAAEIGVIAGHGEPVDWPPGWCGAPMRVQTWLNEGWPREVILIAVRESMGRKRDGPPDSVNYFEKAVARAVARQSAPLPKVVTSSSPEVIHAQADQRHPGGAYGASKDRGRAAHAELKAFLAEPGSGERGGSAVELLPAARRE
jgi:hypothetical protein